ncbi:MAG TPA: antitoxin Xre/MbcA/ParS toxin-binding domain-containing protein [Acetobacteraceae bacterium]|nr:antitoxin Xre/MbcA/ParS toxin-binding domain-containing protein [Acetobacteraceae bacterium]
MIRVGSMYPVTVAKVAAALGGARTLGALPSTVGELAEAVAHGLPRGVVREIAANAAPRGKEARQMVADLVVSSATLKRNERLSPSASERAERLARIVALAQQTLGDEDQARSWLNEPHSLLGGRPPIHVAATDLGARQVERILVNIEYGLPI